MIQFRKNNQTTYDPWNELRPPMGWVKPSDLLVPEVDSKFWENDYNKDLMCNIGTVGIKVPVLINEDGLVLDGIFRVHCSVLFGFLEVPVDIVTKKEVRDKVELFMGKFGYDPDFYEEEITEFKEFCHGICS